MTAPVNLFGTFLDAVASSKALNKDQPNVPADSFCGTLSANVDNARMNDAEFRDFVRRTLPIVIYPRKPLTPE